MLVEAKLGGWRATTSQGALAAVTALLLTFTPPPHGRTLLIPLNGKAIDRSVLDRSMLVVISPGPLPGSVIVEGKGSSLASALMRHGILMAAAPAALCGGDSPPGASLR